MSLRQRNQEGSSIGIGTVIGGAVVAGFGAKVGSLGAQGTANYLGLSPAANVRIPPTSVDDRCDDHNNLTKARNKGFVKDEK